MTAKIMEARILSNEEIAAGVYRILLQNGSEALAGEPGQFINIYLQNKSMLLPRPISISFAEADRITLIYKIAGKGTKELSSYRTGDSISISTPLGRGYSMDAVFESLDGKSIGEEKTIALVAGGLGVPPMLELAKTLQRCLEERNKKQKGPIKLIALIGFAEEVFLAEELKRYCGEVYIATENGSAGYHGNILEMMERCEINADYYLACGPKPMLKALAAFCNKADKPLQVSLEERMGCGYGACVGCTCKIKEQDGGIIKVKQKKVCKDGPVFFGNEVIWDE